MGLDMYLTRNIYIGANYQHNEVTGTIELFRKGNPIPVDISRVTTIVEHVGYWRKANAIHAWFVRNCQDGIDDCKETYVPYPKLRELLHTCKTVLSTKDTSLLPPQEGFFFGSTDIDQDYWSDINDTIDILEALPDPPEHTTYYYQSSW